MGSKQISQRLLNCMSFVVFMILDLVDSILCIVYSYLDEFFEGTSSSCYCHTRDDENEGELSETLYKRPNLFRELGLFKSQKKAQNSKQKLAKDKAEANRWSDCGCKSCVAWMNNGDDLKLHVVVQEPAAHDIEDSENKLSENVIFLHGFICSSSFWTESVFCNMSERTNKNYRLFAIDLLGFGRSPKPRDCSYTLRDHVEMIEKSVIIPFQLKSFHLVGHSMGCVIALALAAKYPQFVKSITLIAPPYFPSSTEDASLLTLRNVAMKSLWPPLVFGASFMSWYEHLGRTMCFIICRNHRIWEFLLRLLTWKRDLHFTIMDLTRHTHHSAWHTMHNVICGGAKLIEEYLKILRNTRVKFTIIQGEEDQVVPIECSYNIKMKVPEVDVRIIPKTDHSSIILAQTKEFTHILECVWKSCH